jgi:polyhydroxyalkanoate synthesis regulator protein
MRSTEPILVKRYAGSRLYDAAEARYVTLDDLRQWQARGIRFEVRKAETGADISASCSRSTRAPSAIFLVRIRGIAI